MKVYAMVELLQQLMTDKLGYQKFMLRAGDIGSGVAKEWAILQPLSVLGLHLSGFNPYIFQVPQYLRDGEKKFLEKRQQFLQGEGA